MITSLVAHKNFMLYVALPIIASTALPLNADSWAYWIVLLALLAVTGLLLRSDFLSGKWLYTPVTVWENMQGNASLERSGALIARLEGTLGKIFPLFVFVIINVSILAIMVSWSLMKNIRQGAGPADSAVEITAAGLGVTLSIVLCTLLCPLIGIGYALFYLKARQAGGETFKEI